MGGLCGAASVTRARVRPGSRRSPRIPRRHACIIWTWAAWGGKRNTRRWWAWPDDSHRGHANFIDALEDEKLGWIRHEAIVTCSVGSAPYGGCGHHGKLDELYEERKANGAHLTDDFVAAYPTMVFDQHAGQPHIVLDVTEDQANMFERMGSARLVGTVSEKAKANRWFQASRKWRSLMPDLSFILYLINNMGMQLKWWPTLSCSPLGRLLWGNEAYEAAWAAHKGDGVEELADAAPVRHGAPAGAPPGHADPASRGVAASNWASEKFDTGKIPYT